MIKFNGKELYKFKEVSKIIDKSISTLFKWKTKNLINVVKIGFTNYIEINELNRIVEGKIINA